MRRVSLILVLMLLVSGSSRVGAQEATPTIDVPEAALCTTSAPSFEQLNAAVGTLDDGTPIAVRTPAVVPAGTPADPATAADVTATIRELVACFNAGEPLRAYALYTDDYLHRLFARQGGFTRASYDSYATPEPEADASRHTGILDIRDIRLLGDGRAGATVTMHYASIPMPKRFFFTFVWTGGRWMIDDILGEISFSVG